MKQSRRTSVERPRSDRSNVSSGSDSVAQHGQFNGQTWQGPQLTIQQGERGLKKMPAAPRGVAAAGSRPLMDKAGELTSQPAPARAIFKRNFL
jgi:hypothetical protein